MKENQIKEIGIKYKTLLEFIKNLKNSGVEHEVPNSMKKVFKRIFTFE